MVGGGSSKACILYIRYSYSSKLLGTNIFDIRIRSGTQEQIYSIFVFIFGKLSGYEYIQYSYSVKFSFTNMFVFTFDQEFDIFVTPLPMNDIFSLSMHQYTESYQDMKHSFSILRESDVFIIYIILFECDVIQKHFASRPLDSKSIISFFAQTSPNMNLP